MSRKFQEITANKERNNSKIKKKAMPFLKH